MQARAISEKKAQNWKEIGEGYLEGGKQRENIINVLSSTE